MTASLLGGRTTWRAISGLVEGSRIHALVAGVLALGQAALLLPVAQLVRHVFDIDIPRDDGHGIVLRGVLIAVCYGASAALNTASGLYAARVTRLAVGRMRRRLVARLELLPLSWHDRHDAGKLHAVVVQDCARVDRMVDSLMSQVLPAATTLVALGAVAVVLDAGLTSAMLVLVALMFAGTRRFARSFERKLSIWHSSSEAFSTHTHAMLDGLRTIRAAGAPQLRRFEREIDTLTDALYQATASGSRYQSLQGGVSAVAGVAVLVAGGLLVAHHDLTLGGLLAFYAVIALMFRQLSTALGSAPIMLEGAIAIRRIQELAAAEEPGAYDGTRRLDFRGAIELDHVTFAYGGAQRPALSDVCLRVATGEHVCIVGASGAGKTTLMAVMLGLYRPPRGQARADGVALADVDLVDLRRQIGVVLQDAVLFPGTIRENLLLTCGEADEEAIRAAIRTATADEFLDDLPRGMETVLGDGGGGLSGGQRQRLAVARAVLARPRLIVLDEPTAHVPRASGARIVENLTRLPWRPTVLIITHDPAIAARAGRIVHLRDGRATAVVSETGEPMPRVDEGPAAEAR